MLSQRGEPSDIRAQTFDFICIPAPPFSHTYRSETYSSSVREPWCSPTGEAASTLFLKLNALILDVFLPLPLSVPPTHRTAWLALCPSCLYLAPTASIYTLSYEREDKAWYKDSPYGAHLTPCAATLSFTEALFFTLHSHTETSHFRKLKLMTAQNPIFFHCALWPLTQTRDGRQRSWLQLPETDTSNYSPRLSPEVACTQRYNREFGIRLFCSCKKLVCKSCLGTYPAKTQAFIGEYWNIELWTTTASWLHGT